MSEAAQESATTEVVDEKRIKKMCLILSKATLDNVYAYFILANGARMEGIEAEIFFTFFNFYTFIK